MDQVATVFLLSPAHCGGKRAALLFRPQADFPLARRLRGAGATLGEVYRYVSGLYFRGKLAYARAFHGAPRGRPGVLVIVPGRGLVAPSRRITLDELEAIAAVGVRPDDASFREPHARDAARLARRVAAPGRSVLLGSIATDKYVSVLEASLSRRLQFPEAFVGRGDMSRGGLLLRCVREGRELTYAPIEGAIRRGRRPPRLAPLGPGHGGA
jgi:hypothetical protein